MDFIPFATTSLDKSKILRRGAFLFLVLLAVLFVPPPSVVVRLASCVRGGALLTKSGGFTDRTYSDLLNNNNNYNNYNNGLISVHPLYGSSPDIRLK